MKFVKLFEVVGVVGLIRDVELAGVVGNAGDAKVIESIDL